MVRKDKHVEGFAMRVLLFLTAALLLGTGPALAQDVRAACNQNTDIVASLEACNNIATDPKIPKETQAKAYARLCYLIGKENLWYKTIEVCTKANELAPNAANYTNLGVAANTLCQYADAISYYSKAIEMDPMRPELYYWRSFAYKALHEKEKSEDDLKEFERLTLPVIK